jgi:hypothetical protein
MNENSIIRAAHGAQRSKRWNGRPLTPPRFVRGSEEVCKLTARGPA